MLPRGLITAVLALQIVAARGPDFKFLPAMAFTVVLVTNAFVVIAAVLSRKPQTVSAAVVSEPVAALSEPIQTQAAGAGVAES
jgi:hypothetical protein